ncbi:hypothetical protein P3L10_024398 [Capsicum annuum]
MMWLFLDDVRIIFRPTDIGEMPIWNDDSLSLFLHTIEIFGNRLNLQTLDMYACVEHSPIVEQPTDSEFDVRVSQNSLNLNIDSSRMAMEQQFDGGFETHYQNSPELVNNFDMGGPSSATMNLKNFNSSGPQYPSSVEAINRFNDCGFTLTQLTEIVNNNDDVQGELDSDEPSQYESSDDDQFCGDDDDDNNDENVNGESIFVGVYTDNHSSIIIPYLDQKV